MASFVVMERATVPAGTVADDARLIKDGFSFIGFIAPPLWLLWHGLIAEAAVVFAFMFGIAAGAEALGFAPAGSLLSLLVSALCRPGRVRLCASPVLSVAAGGKPA